MNRVGNLTALSLEGKLGTLARTQVILFGERGVEWARYTGYVSGAKSQILNLLGCPRIFAGLVRLFSPFVSSLLDAEFSPISSIPQHMWAVDWEGVGKLTFLPEVIILPVEGFIIDSRCGGMAGSAVDIFLELEGLIRMDFCCSLADTAFSLLQSLIILSNLASKLA